MLSVIIGAVAKAGLVLVYFEPQVATLIGAPYVTSSGGVVQLKSIGPGPERDAAAIAAAASMMLTTCGGGARRWREIERGRR